MINVMETLQNILNNNKGDTKLYKIIFNNLSDNNNIKNYTDNRNGIFFNMNNFDSEKIKNLFNKKNTYGKHNTTTQQIAKDSKNNLNELFAKIETEKNQAEDRLKIKAAELREARDRQYRQNIEAQRRQDEARATQRERKREK